MQVVRSARSIGAPLLFRELPRFAFQLLAPATGALFSTEESAPPLPSGWQDNLWSRVFAVGDPRRSVVPVLERWVADGNPVEKNLLKRMIKEMRSTRRYAHALQISTWMSDRRYFDLSLGDIAFRLDLVKKVHGLEQAESYFNSIPKQSKVYQVYGTLLSCYVDEKCVEKAEALFHKMEESSMLNTFAYNLLMKMYTEIGILSKVDDIFQEMEKKEFAPDLFTYNVLLEAYAKGANTEGIEKVLRSIEQSKNSSNWYSYAIAARGYTNAGSTDTALAMLKKSKERIPQKRSQVAYGLLLSLCADIGNKDEMYQVWNMYKASGKVANTVHMCMISGLLKLDDLESAEGILDEWESVVSNYDFRVPKLLLSAYCTRGLVEKAELLIDKATASGRTPHASSWDKLASLYFTCGQSSKAVDAMKKALAVEGVGWRPNPTNIAASLEYLQEQKDVQGAQEISRSLRNHGLLTREIYNSLLKIYVCAGKPATDLLEQMAKDGYDADEETCEVLGEKKSQNNLAIKTENNFQENGTEVNGFDVDDEIHKILGEEINPKESYQQC